MWDATGLRLEVSRVGHRAHFGDSRLPPDGAQLRRLLVGALDRANRPPSKDATRDDIAAIAYEAFRLRADTKPFFVVVALIAALAGIAVGIYLLLAV